MPADRHFWLDVLAEDLHHRSRLLTASVILILLLLPFALAFFDGSLAELFTTGTWRILLLPGVMIVYNLTVAPFLGGMDSRIATGIRPLSQLNDEAYADLVAKTKAENRRAQWIAFGLGVLAQIGLYGLQRSYTPLELYLSVAFAVMFGTLGWITYKAVASTRLSRTLPRHQLTVNLFDITPFEPIGRQSLLLAMSFVGGVTLSLFFVFSREDILQWRNVVIYSVLLLITVLIFFFNMWPTHSLLSHTRKEHIEQATRAIGTAYAELTALRAQNADTAAVESSLDTWMALEKRLKVTRTWPYNTEMLRALVLTVLTPIAVALSRIAAVVLTSGRP